MENNNSNLIVSTGGIGKCTITVSNIDYGGEYYQTYTNVSSATFSNLPNVYTMVITKDNYIPYVYVEGCLLTNKTIDNYRLIENCEETQIGEVCVEPQNPTNNNTTIDSCGQVKITSTGSLEVHNGGIVIIKNLSMEEDSELHIY